MVEQVGSFAELPGPAVVVFQDLDDPALSATFGEVMCTTYKAFGAAGLITSGAARDLDQVAVLNFPCFANSTICAHGYCHIVQINIPVRAGGLMVHPGDLLHGDCNGVARIPNDLAKAVIDGCPELAAAEAVVLEYLRAGKVTKDGFAAARKESQRRIEALAKKLQAHAGSH
jgi:regulator of RNase E activity RraA